MVTKEEIDKYIKAYNNGTPLISDTAYDELLEEYINGDESKRPFTRQKQSDNINDVVGTLPKVYGVLEPMREGQSTYADWLRKKNISKKVICLQPKFDGCSVAKDMNTNECFTRGDYDDGESVNVSDLFRDHTPVNNSLNSVKYEAIMSDETFKELNLYKKYARPRDAVTAIMKLRDIDLAKYITLIPLRLYSKDKKQFISDEVEHLSVFPGSESFEDIQSFIDDKLINEAEVEYWNPVTRRLEHYAIDGVVASVANITDDDIQLVYVDGEEVAIKILNHVETTKLIDVKFQIGNSGRVTPVAIVEPVKFGNVTVTNITMSNLERVYNLGLKRNDTVNIMYNIVPYFMGSNHDGDIPIQIPLKCPICGHDYDLSTLSIVRCINPECDSFKLGSIIRYCTKMRMFGVSDGIITKLYDANIITSIPSLYNLDEYAISQVPGFGALSANNIVKAINATNTNIEMHKWLGAFPMNDVGSKMWKRFIDTVGLDFVVECIWHNDLITLTGMLINTTIVGIGDITRDKMVNGLDKNWNNIQQIYPFLKFILNTNNPSGELISMTGTRDAELTKYLNDKGYKVDSFSTKTKVLIIPNKEFKSSKVIKAMDRGIPVYTIKEAYEKL